MTRRSLMLMTGLMLCSPAVLVAQSNPNFSWYAQNYEGDIWITLSNGTTPQFDFRIGGGGCIAEMRNATTGYTEMLSPTYNGNHTDRVLQYTFWATGIKGTASAPDQRFNIDLAGDETGAFQKIISVSNTGSGTGANIDVYSVANLQWYPALNPNFAGTDPIPSLTRYQLLSSGVLKVRRVVRVPNIVLNGVTQPPYALYFENWNTIGQNDTMDSMALSLDSTGNPNWWYSLNNFPDYPAFPFNTGTYGYAVAFKNGSVFTQPAVSFIFGKQQTAVENLTGTTASAILNSLLVSPEQGVAILPATTISAVSPGSIVDMEFRIVPRLTSGSELESTTLSQVQLVAAPIVYGPTTQFTGELATIVTILNANKSKQGTQTEHLGSFWVNP